MKRSPVLTRITERAASGSRIAKGAFTLMKCSGAAMMLRALPRIFDGTDRLPYMYDKNGWLAVMDGAKAVDFPSRNTIQKMADQMANWGDGARAIVRVQWKGGRSGHVFMAEQQKGGTVFMDPQTGRYVDIHVYMDQAVKGATKLVRIDNLKPTALLEKCVKKRDK